MSTAVVTAGGALLKYQDAIKLGVAIICRWFAWRKAGQVVDAAKKQVESTAEKAFNVAIRTFDQWSYLLIGTYVMKILSKSAVYNAKMSHSLPGSIFDSLSKFSFEMKTFGLNLCELAIAVHMAIKVIQSLGPPTTGSVPSTTAATSTEKSK